MSGTSPLRLKNVLRLASVVEFCTGAALILAPAMVVRLLLGTALSAGGMPVARVAGAALLGLGLAGWPAAEGRAALPALRGMLAYNALVSSYLVLVEVRHHLGGLLLWPAVAFHAIMALALVWTWRRETHEERSDLSP